MRDTCAEQVVSNAKTSQIKQEVISTTSCPRVFCSSTSVSHKNRPNDYETSLKLDSREQTVRVPLV